MRADKDDAPWSVRQQRSDSAALQLFCLLAGCTAIGGLLLFNSERLTTNPPPLPVMTAPTPDRAATTQPAAPRQQRAPAVISPAERPRQTDFNDHNYQPRTDINTIPAPRPRPQSSSTAHTPQPLVQRSALWSWGSSGTHRQGTFIWHERGGRIDWGSVCSNYRDGSLEYRSCRKAAKVVFARLCSRNARSPACAAEHSYNPVSG